MKKVLMFLMIILSVTSSCSSQPSDTTIQTAIAQTQSTIPMDTKEPTSKPELLVKFTTEPTTTPILPTTTPTPIVYTISIEVVDPVGDSISNAKVISDEDEDFTNEQGKWSAQMTRPDFSGYVWAQGYKIQSVKSELEPGENDVRVELETDPFGLKPRSLELEGYKLVFLEDFQDNSAECFIRGNGNVFQDEIQEGNYYLLVDLRNLDSSFSCSFGPTNIDNGIIEVDFFYPEIRYNDFKTGDYYNWQGYFVSLRNGISVSGFPILVPWGPGLQITDSRLDKWKYPITVKQPVNVKEWYTLTTIWQGPVIEAKINDWSRFNYLNAPVYKNKGPADIGAYSEAYIAFDNIKMWVPMK